VPVSLAVTRVGTNRLQVSISVSGTLQSVSWTPAASFAIEDANGTAIGGGVLTLPANSSTSVFYLRKVSGASVTVPLTLTGSFGTWRTFVGGGQNAW